MKTFQHLRRAITPLQQTLTGAARASSNQPTPILNLLNRTTHQQQFSSQAARQRTLAARRKPLTSPFLRQPFRQRRPYSTDPKKPPYNPTPHLNSPQPSLSLSARFRKLTREYGWSAFGVYLLLVALDFPFCFAAVRYLGTDRIGHYEHVVVEWIKSAIPESVVGKFREWRERLRKKEDEAEMEMVTIGGVAGEERRVEAYGEVKDGVAGEERRVEAYGEVKDGVAEVVGFDHGVKEAEEANGSDNASIWTQLALAYAIHKSFIFLRVPLTAAVTPKVVKTLRGWGWDIGKRKPKGPK